ncbi:hypothetical protein [Lyngbya sp. PCC 8106]|uniref:hypothetical protein n=1 Tax=Lyngbya sp. (strain PCC 8106) TaxID=313612 RepID=UPI0000EAD5CE|nr:hypothetical protein [Lyngbya sp. PCC 8106]EAW37695.1 fructose-1,6-bisphosphatase [Lyngbya sp. PCC 8106]
MEVILVYLILAVVLVWNDQGSSSTNEQDDRSFEKIDYNKDRSQPNFYQEKKQPEYVRYLDIEYLEMNHSQNRYGSRKI